MYSIFHAWACEKRALFFFRVFSFLWKRLCFYLWHFKHILRLVLDKRWRKEPWNDVCLCVNDGNNKTRRKKNALRSFAKSTFHHFYNAYIRLWVLGFYAIFFLCALPLVCVCVFHILHRCLFRIHSKTKLCSSEWLFVPFNAFKAVHCANTIFLLFFHSHLMWKIRSTNLFMIHSQRENKRNENSKDEKYFWKKISQGDKVYTAV